MNTSSELRFIVELQSAKRASGAPGVREFGKPSSRENLVMTSRTSDVRPSGRLWRKRRGVSR